MKESYLFAVAIVPQRCPVFATVILVSVTSNSASNSTFPIGSDRAGPKAIYFYDTVAFVPSSSVSMSLKPQQ